VVFQVSVANATVLRLTRELAFIDEVLAAAAAGKLRPQSTNHFVDRCKTLLSPPPFFPRPLTEITESESIFPRLMFCK